MQRTPLLGKLPHWCSSLQIAGVFLESFALYNISDAGSSEGYLTVEGNAGDRNDLSAWHGGVCLGCDVLLQQY